MATAGTDAALRSAASDPEAAGALVGELFRRHATMVYGVCRLVLRDRGEAEDATQQTFLCAHRSVLKGTVPRDGAAWLATIARHECQARLRRRGFETVALAEGDGACGADDPARIAERDAEIEALSKALAELPRSQRQALVLREFYGLTYAEVAIVLGVSGSAVESLIFRSRLRLQERLRPLRRAAGVLTLPIGLREALEAAIPGFGPAATGAGAAGVGGAVLAKLTVPVAAKLAAAMVAVGTVGTVAAVEQSTPVSAPDARTAGFKAGKAPPPRAPDAPIGSAGAPVVQDRRSGESEADRPPAPRRSRGRSPGPAQHPGPGGPGPRERPEPEPAPAPSVESDEGPSSETDRRAPPDAESPPEEREGPEPPVADPAGSTQRRSGGSSGPGPEGGDSSGRGGGRTELTPSDSSGTSGGGSDGATSSGGPGPSSPGRETSGGSSGPGSGSTGTGLSGDDSSGTGSGSAGTELSGEDSSGEGSEGLGEDGSGDGDSSGKG